MRRIPVAALVSVLALFAAAPVEARQSREWWPGATYDSGVPTPASVLGYEIGEYWTEHFQMLDYMRRLEAASKRVKVFSVGRSNEKRELILVAVSDPANIQRLEEIRTTVARLRDPRQTTEAQAREIARATPAIAWMNFANDGNESAAFETAIQLAYHLAAGTDGTTQRILKDVVTIIYPAHNPESHSRHVAWMKASAAGNPDPDAQEHRGDWRMDTNNNHYQVDLNRDAVFLSQVESRVIIRELHRWNPVVFIDHHGNPDRFFFPPWALPVNAQIDARSKDWVETYGRNIAAAFDRHGWTYFTRQVYDLHYPGYYDSYPALNGATGMTFETDGGGSKGLAYRLPDNRITTLFDGILHHFTGAVSSLLTTAEQREARVMDLYEFRATAMADVAKEKVKGFVLVPGKDPSRAADLVGLLLQHHIEVFRTGAPVTSATAHALMSGETTKRTFPAGSYVVPANQPQKRLLRTLLDPETPLEAAFLDDVREAKAYNDKVGESAPKKSYGFYDINAWSLPLAYGVEAYWTEEAIGGPAASGLSRVTERPGAAFAPPDRAGYGYLFRWNSRGATRMVAELWKEEHQLAVTTRPMTLDGREFDAGMVVARVQTNPATLHERIAALAKANEVEVVSVSSALVDAGRDLGDRSVIELKPAKIAVVCEPPTSVTAYGAIWFLLEQQYGIPFTAIKAADLNNVELAKYNVIVLPDGQASGYRRAVAEELVNRLENWVREGGTLVAIKGAAVWASGDGVELTTARDRYATPPRDRSGEGGEAGEQEPSGDEEETPKRIETVPGVFVQVDVDADHYVGLGIDGPVAALFRSNVIFNPTRRGARVASLDPERPVIAGFTFEEARAPLQGAPFVWDEPTGRGHVTLFADDPAFRTFLHGAHRLLLNAMLLGPSM